MNARGKIVLTIVILAVLGFGLWQWRATLFGGGREPAPNAGGAASAPSSTREPSASASSAPAVELAETQREVPRIAPPGIYAAKDGVVEVELSEYAGYAGLIAANGGLSASASSYFATKHGFQVKLTISEEESWSALNSGKLAASATTADVLAVYGKQFHVVVPAQIGYSRGADGVVVTSEVKRINQLEGKVLAASQFTEADFFIRYLAQEAGLAVHMLSDLSESPDPKSLNLVYALDAFQAGDLFLSELASGQSRLSGCVTWDPKTTEVVEASGGKARLLATNTNLLIVADVLVVNAGFAQEHPAWVSGLVDGLLAGNRMVRDEQEKHLDVVSKAFGWDKEETRSNLSKVHLSNLPENLAFFSGAIDAAGSFGGIYQSAVFAYGSELVADPIDAEHFARLDALQALASAGAYADQRISIQPIVGAVSGIVEGDPLLTKSIRFSFEMNSAKLDVSSAANQSSLVALRELLRVSPGSTVLLRGHVDDAMVEEHRRLGGEPAVRQARMSAYQLSKERAAEVRRILIDDHAVDASRIEIVGRGWDEPLGRDPAANRRVEVQWFLSR